MRSKFSLFTNLVELCSCRTTSPLWQARENWFSQLSVVVSLLASECTGKRLDNLVICRDVLQQVFESSQEAGSRDWNKLCNAFWSRHGVYRGHTGSILQLLCLGDYLLSLGTDARVLLWKIGEYDAPQVHPSTQSTQCIRERYPLSLVPLNDCKVPWHSS